MEELLEDLSWSHFFGSRENLYKIFVIVLFDMFCFNGVFLFNLLKNILMDDVIKEISKHVIVYYVKRPNTTKASRDSVVRPCRRVHHSLGMAACLSVVTVWWSFPKFLKQWNILFFDSNPMFLPWLCVQLWRKNSTKDVWLPARISGKSWLCFWFRFPNYAQYHNRQEYLMVSIL